jgi:hypothetical protein
MSREVDESPLRQGDGEAIQYHIRPTPAPLSVSTVTVTDEATGLAAGTATGSPTVQAGAIVLPTISGLTAGHTYRVDVTYTDGTNTLEPYLRIVCER